LHERQVKCYIKGKEHKNYDFGSKVSILVTQDTRVIVGALNFNKTVQDSKPLPSAIQQYERLMEKFPSHINLDRGY
jgi:transposase, IS5 family